MLNYRDGALAFSPESFLMLSVRRSLGAFVSVPTRSHLLFSDRFAVP
jgi:hypothetical protein